MGQKSGPVKEPAEQVVKEIRRATRRQFSAEEKIRIVLSGLRGEDSIAELCRREGIVQNLYYRWSKDENRRARHCAAGQRAGPGQADRSTAAGVRHRLLACRGRVANWVDVHKIKHLRGEHYHPMPQGKIEGWH